MRRRGFEIISNQQFDIDFKDKKANYYDLKLPKRKTQNAAGYDFRMPYDLEIKSNEKVIIPTGIKSYLLSDEWLAIYIRSSLGFKYNLRLCNQVGVIDSDYYNNESNEGHIFIAIKNEGKKAVYLKKGEGFAQGVFSKFLTIDNEKEIIEKRTGGIGSTNGSDSNEK